MLEDQVAEILALIDARRWQTVRERLHVWPPADLADLLLRLPSPERVLLFRALPRPLATEAFAHLAPEEQDGLLRELTDEETRHVLAGLSPDDRTALLEELPGTVTQRLITLLSPEDRDEAMALLGYPEESVGRLMTPDYVAVRPGWSIARALQHVRERGKDSETIDRIYVIGDDWRLLDDIGLRRLILADPEWTVERIMDHSFVAIPAHADQEAAVGVFRRHHLPAVPVLDSDGVLVGIVTIDDVLHVAVEEATEDFHKVGSVGPLRTGLRDASARFLYRRRIGWLLSLVLVNVFTGAGIAYFEEIIAATLVLVIFLPLLIDSAGNAGSQAATLVVRALATGDVHARDWVRLAGKEFAVAAALGLTMAAAVSVVSIARGGPEVALVVAATMVLVIIVGSLAGLSLPFVLNRIGFDPATASAPLVTSIADVSGVVIYFTIASAILGP